MGSPSFIERKPVGKVKAKLFGVNRDMLYHASKYGRFKFQHGPGFFQQVDQQPGIVNGAAGIVRFLKLTQFPAQFFDLFVVAVASFYKNSRIHAPLSL